MDRILESVRLRRVFLFFFGSTVAVAVLVRWLAIGSTAGLGPVKEAIARILEGYVSSSFVTTILGIVIYIGTSEIRRASSEIEILPAGDINQRFVAAQSATKTWYFKGGLGRYFTSETLENTLKNGSTGYRLRAYLIDPFNSTLCSYVASHRGEGETGAHIRLEALVTILEFTRRVHSKRTLVAEAYCGLIDDFAPIRIDLTDDGVFITHDKPSASATYYRKQSQFYSSYEQELTTGPNSYLVINITELVRALSQDGIFPPTLANQDYARNVFSKVSLLLAKDRPSGEFTISDEEVSALVTLAKRRRSPY